LASQKKSLEHVQPQASVRQQHLMLLMSISAHSHQAKVFLRRLSLQQFFLQLPFSQLLFLQQPS